MNFFEFISELDDAYLYDAPQWAKDLLEMFEKGGRKAVEEAIHRGKMAQRGYRVVYRHVPYIEMLLPPEEGKKDVQG